MDSIFYIPTYSSWSIIYFADIFIENRIAEENPPELQQFDHQALSIISFGNIKSTLKRTQSL